MRIVQALGWYFPDSLGGTEVYVAALARCLRALGHDVLIAAPEPGVDRERSYTYDDIAVYRYPIPTSVSRAEARGETPVRGAERFHRWLAHERADIVHLHTFVTGLGLFEAEAARASGARVVATTHAASLGFTCVRGTLMHHGREVCDGVAEPGKCAACALGQRGVPIPLARAIASLPDAVATSARRIPGPLGTLLGFRALIERNADMQRRLFAAVSAFVVLSDYAARVLIANGAPPGKVVVNRLGIRDGCKWRRKPSPSDRPSHAPMTVGFVGRAEPIKGLDDVVRAVASLPKDVPLRLRIVAPAASAGDRRFLDECRRLAAGDDRILFERAASPDEMPSLLADLDLVVCPSRVVEGGPTVALEAHAVGTPVIGAAVPALTEYVRDGVNGALFPPGDWQQLARCLRQIARDPEKTVDRWRTELERPRTFDEVTREYLELYQAG